MGTLDYGWVYIERGGAKAMQIACKSWSFDMQWNNQESIKDMAGDSHIGYDLQRIGRIITLYECYFKTKTDIETLIDYAQDINNAGKATVEIRCTSDALPGSLFNFKSGTTSLEMLFRQLGGIQKVAMGDGTVYACSKIVLRQAG